MICPSCRRGLARLSQQRLVQPNISSHPSRRTIATVPATPNAAPTTPSQPPTSRTPDQLSSKPSDQPFSEPFFPSSSAMNTTPLSTPIVSSCPGGTSLASLSYVKQPQKPLVALEDHEYPAWLWTLVPDPSKPKAMSGGVDLSAMTAKTRAKYERKMAKLATRLEKPVPIHEQAKDLTAPGEGAEIHMQRQKELTGSMRVARRKAIRENNFLKSM